MNQRLPKAALATSLIAAGLLVACGGGGGGSSGSGTGTLSVSLTDAPACGFDEVNVTVSKVRVHRSDSAAAGASGWVDIQVNPTKINLLDLTNGVMAALGQTTLPAGRYTQLRLVLEPNHGSTLANSVLPSGGGEKALVTPSGATSGIKLNANIEVTEGNTTDIALDFDACKSIVKRGNGSFGLKPVISIIPIATSGVISGYVAPSIASTSNNTVVSAQIDGVIKRSTVPDPVTGKFDLSPITAGTYDIVVTADSYASDVITDVPVTASATTTLSTDGSPLSLNPNGSTTPTASGTVTLSGTVKAIDAAPIITATQTFSSGKKVIIKYQTAEVTGDYSATYSMLLPNAAPRISTFGTGTLPLTLTPESSSAGQYRMEASAEGYKSSDPLTIDIEDGTDAVEDFTLVP